MNLRIILIVLLGLSTSDAVKNIDDLDFGSQMLDNDHSLYAINEQGNPGRPDLFQLHVDARTFTINDDEEVIIGRLLGSGEVADVYRSEKKKGKKDYAIKVFDVWEDAEAKEQFDLAKNMSSELMLRMPGQKPYDIHFVEAKKTIGGKEKVYLMVMPFLEGYQPLGSVYNPASKEKARKLTRAQVVDILGQIGEILSSYGKPHGDLHAGNIMVNIEGDKLDIVIIDPNHNARALEADVTDLSEIIVALYEQIPNEPCDAKTNQWLDELYKQAQEYIYQPRDWKRKNALKLEGNLHDNLKSMPKKHVAQDASAAEVAIQATEVEDVKKAPEAGSATPATTPMGNLARKISVSSA